MIRTFVILFIGLAAGVAAHFTWLSMNRPAHTDSLEGQLAWMKADLQLSDEQLARIKSLHEKSTPRLLALAAEVSRMRDEFAAFEHERKTTEKIDFLEFARFVEQRRSLDRECIDSTKKLILASANVMTPQQREHYLALISPTLKTTENLLPN